MATERCPVGHYYDESRYSSCPACGVPGIEIVPTRPGATVGGLEDDGARTEPVATGDRDAVMAPPAGDAAGSPGRTRHIETPPRRLDEAKTVGLVRRQLGIDPVVGWLVCIAGPDRGRDFRLRSERNFLGRDEDMDVRLNDPTVSRSKHAIVSFNPVKASFRVIPGDSHGLVYLNDEEVDHPQPLSAGDILVLGDSRLMFVPFCGENFSWTEAI